MRALAMTYFQIGTILCRPFAGRLIDGLDKRIILLISSALFFIIMGLFNLTTSLQTIFVLRGIHGAIFALGTTVMAALAVVVLPASRKGGRHQYVCCILKYCYGIRSCCWFICITSLWKLSAIYFSDYNDCTSIYFEVMSFDCLKELAKPKQKSSKGWSISQFIEKTKSSMGINGIVYRFHILWCSSIYSY